MGGWSALTRSETQFPRGHFTPCQFPPDMGPSIFGQDGPLVKMPLHTKLLLTDDKQKTIVSVTL
jgi:hypothetical protein